jgi:hypothetical protein
MIDCLAIGDEIAIRMSAFVGCRPTAATGRSAFDQAALMRDTRADRVLISLGTHPAHYRDPNLFVDMRYVRSRIVAKQVVWILPLQPEARAAVRKVAALHGDALVEVSGAF